jgi:hypothetical protein
MRRALTLHPDERCGAVTGIEVAATRPAPGRLALHYAVAGELRDLSVPAVTAPTRADGLWRATCFEAFVRRPTGEAYGEFNMSPSRQWACYRFGAYRAGMAPMAGVGDPRIDVALSETRLDLRAVWDLDGAADLQGEGPWRLGLSAVIEEAGGRISHWALAHPSGKADFHHADSFALQLTIMDP